MNIASSLVGPNHVGLNGGLAHLSWIWWDPYKLEHLDWAKFDRSTHIGLRHLNWVEFGGFHVHWIEFCGPYIDWNT